MPHAHCAWSRPARGQAACLVSVRLTPPSFVCLPPCLLARLPSLLPVGLLPSRCSPHPTQRTCLLPLSIARAGGVGAGALALIIVAVVVVLCGMG